VAELVDARALRSLCGNHPWKFESSRPHQVLLSGLRAPTSPTKRPSKAGASGSPAKVADLNNHRTDDCVAERAAWLRYLFMVRIFWDREASS